MTLHLDAIVLHVVRLPLVSPFTTSFGTEKEKVALLLEARTTVSVGGDSREVVGWGECVAMEEPLYSSEYISGVQALLVDHLLPRLYAAQRARPLTAETVGEVLAPVVGHPMAKAALEMALPDAGADCDHLQALVDIYERLRWRVVEARSVADKLELGRTGRLLGRAVWAVRDPDAVRDSVDRELLVEMPWLAGLPAPDMLADGPVL